MFARRIVSASVKSLKTAQRSYSIARIARPMALRCVPMVTTPVKFMSTDADGSMSLSEVLSQELQVTFTLLYYTLLFADYCNCSLDSFLTFLTLIYTPLYIYYLFN